MQEFSHVTVKRKGQVTIPLEPRSKLGREEGALFEIKEAAIADTLIASFVKMGLAEYVVTDDRHFKSLGIKTKWL
jgi:bifunctional DNA-binding transcriptional regulator/antitoxin component of YhaV-PrlF toxin-antitoxin module